MRTVKISTFYDKTETGLEQVDLVDVYITSDERSGRPTTHIAEGSLSFESDTGMISAFNEADGEWVDQFTIKS